MDLQPPLPLSLSSFEKEVEFRIGYVLLANQNLVPIKTTARKTRDFDKRHCGRPFQRQTMESSDGASPANDCQRNRRRRKCSSSQCWPCLPRDVFPCYCPSTTHCPYSRCHHPRRFDWVTTHPFSQWSYRISICCSLFSNLFFSRHISFCRSRSLTVHFPDLPHSHTHE